MGDEGFCREAEGWEQGRLTDCAIAPRCAWLPVENAGMPSRFRIEAAQKLHAMTFETVGPQERACFTPQ
jgi:hypothetical protein